MTDGHDRSYEAGVDREINLQAIVYATVGLALVVVLSALAMWGLSVGLRSRLVASDPPPPVLPEVRTQVPPPEPRLQASPEGEYELMREQEDAVLEGYAWTDREAGLARVPIERAMELLAEDGS